MHVGVKQHGQKWNWFSKCILLVVGRGSKEEIEIVEEEERDRKEKELLWFSKFRVRRKSWFFPEGPNKSFYKSTNSETGNSIFAQRKNFITFLTSEIKRQMNKWTQCSLL